MRDYKEYKLSKIAKKTPDVVIESKKERPVNAGIGVAVHDTKKDLIGELINYKTCNHFSEFKFIIYFWLYVFRHEKIRVIENSRD